jgi:hypothetical protein
MVMNFHKRWGWGIAGPAEQPKIPKKDFGSMCLVMG